PSAVDRRQAWRGERADEPREDPSGAVPGCGRPDGASAGTRPDAGGRRPSGIAGARYARKSVTSHAWRKMMDIDSAVAEYTTKSSTELADIVVKSYELNTAIAEAHPEMAQDAGFEWFDTSWATRYSRKVASEVS